MNGLRPELQKICEWIEPGSRVLDLGCGDGALLSWLQNNCDTTGYGVEIDQANVLSCLKKGVNIIQADLDAGLTDFEDASFDYVIMTQALQALQRPDKTLYEMMRVGKKSIVTFPNFGLWKHRLHLSIKGQMPVSKALPAQWYDTQNIHLCTVKDFESFCENNGMAISKKDFVDYDHRPAALMKLWPNLFGEVALYQINGK
ncbi:MAG: methionine biosynthesis protein MetW [Cycloclasticus sp. symbiont of Bathymodiolus heckerae]|nr:MAG: methionine biosynthesis protein MetW [Cycloclasticus sp. symbiont of Bathymodiolus heckerae]